MARGWESKSVEAQQHESARPAGAAKPRLTRQEVDRLREKESLALSLKRIVGEIGRSQNLRHRQMLEQAKADLEKKLEKIA